MNRDIDNELFKMRRKARYTREELANVSGVDKNTIQALEVGKTDMSNAKLSTMIKLAKALSCKVRDFFPNEKSI